MIITGDVAIAPGDRFVFTGFDERLIGIPWCINLEGAVAEPGAQPPDWGVCNASDWRRSFDGFQLAPVFIGNNHIHDLRHGVACTVQALARDSLEAFGAGPTAGDASRAVSVESGGWRYVLLGFGWEVIGCKPAGQDVPGVNRLTAGHVLQSLEDALRFNSTARVVVVIHGNYEFEMYPQPGHRQLAMQLIDTGAYAVVFHHSHVVCPVERYRGRTIAYGLGNWAFSYGKFFGGKLSFPESSFHQIVLELGREGDTVHHARFMPETTVRHEFSEHVGAPHFSLAPPFEGFDAKDYLEWFKAHRIKRKGLPIYLDATDSCWNIMRNRWVAARQVMIDAAAKSGLKAMRRRL